MTKLIPSLNSCLGRMTAGEKRVARLLESHLEDDYLCWYEPTVGNPGRIRYTDFIILHPSRGLLLLEVKDWKMSSLRNVDRQFFRLMTDSGLQSVQHPLEQVRQCTYRLIDGLRRDPALTHEAGCYTGKLVCPYAFGVVFTAITRQEFDTSGMEAVLPENLVICRDEMTESVDPEVFQKRLWDMFAVQFPTPLTLPQIDRIRAHLFPEIVIQGTGSLFPDDHSATDKPESSVDDIVKVMDLAQERLARSMGDGHRVIHGVAGSGKTLILGFRCVHLAQSYSKPILVLCFNVTLAARLREIISGNGVSDQVQVRHFHDWCGDQLRTYHVDRPAFGPDYVKELVQCVVDATESGRIPRAQYGAVMIDEGHDFEPDWLRLVVSMIDPDSDSLLLLYDDAQSLYSKSSLKFSLSSVGIKARGRTTVLRTNYRNTDEILAYAYRFARHWLPNEKLAEDGMQALTPESAGRCGPQPQFRLCNGMDEEVRLIVRCITDQHSKGLAWEDICVVYRAKWIGEKLNEAIQAAGLPVHWLKTTSEKKRLASAESTIKLMTMHSSKGLEFPLVIVSGVGSMPGKNAESSTEAKLLYVAMTRATEKLLVTAHQASEFTEILAA